MAELSSYFTDFLSEIRLTPNQKETLKKGQQTLRGRLEEDELADIIVGTYLHGSYMRSTALRPKSGTRSDVDIIVVTKLDMEEYTPKDAHNLFKSFLDKHYEGKYEFKKRSIGIELSNVDLDVVITVTPSETEQEIFGNSVIKSNLSLEDIFNEILNKTSDSAFGSALKSKSFFEKSSDSPEWQMEPLYMADREAKDWKPIHPLEQIRWTYEKNSNTNGHYVNVVKSLKWWKKSKYPNAGHPKSYTLERFIGECCPDNIEYVANGITLTLEKIVEDYPTKPSILPDHGVPNHDVFGRISDEEYEEFYSQINEAAKIARDALDSEDKEESVTKWRELFGSKFPPYTKKSSKSGGFKKRTEKTSNIPGGNFAL